uniref:Plexin domain-containing protein 2 n=1 Tax=Cacopsylla melanoneura TaxID=428564 RepID=A0A8D8ZLU3_9HEMI
MNGQWMKHVPVCLLIILCGAVSKGVATNTNIYYEVSEIRDVEKVKELWLELTDENSTTGIYSIEKEKDIYNRTTGGEPKKSKAVSDYNQQHLAHKLSFNFPAFGETAKNVLILNGKMRFTKFPKEKLFQIIKYEMELENTDVIPIVPLHTDLDLVDLYNHTESNESFIRSFDNGNQFTVSWENMEYIQEPFLTRSYTFQATLYRTGDIAFVYKSVALPEPKYRGIKKEYKDKIYHHHNVNLTHITISNWTAIYMKPLPTCLNHKDCHSCLTDSSTSHMNCSWCPSANLCSMEVDKNHPKWKLNNCNREAITEAQLCSISTEDKIENKTILIGVIIFLSVCLGIVLIKFILRVK